MATDLSITVNGTDVAVRSGSSVITETLNGRNSFECEILTLTRFLKNAEVLVTRSSVREFGGVVNSLQEQSIIENGIHAGEFTQRLHSEDFNSYASRRFAVITIPAGTTQAAMTALLPYLTPFGVTLSMASAGPSLPLLTYYYKNLLEVLNEIATLSKWVWEIGYDKVLRVYDPATNTAPFNIADGDGHVIGDVTLEPQQTEYANRIIVQFDDSPQLAYAFLRLSSGNFADGQTVTIGSQVYTFKTTLVNTAGFVHIGATAALSLENLIAAVVHSGSAEYAAVTTVNASVTAFNVLTDGIYTVKVQALTPGSAGNSIPVATTCPTGLWFGEGLSALSTLARGTNAALTNAVTSEDVAAQAIDGGPWERIYSASGTFSATVAQALADAYLILALASPKTVRYKTMTNGLHPGHIQTIVSAARNFSATCLVTDVVGRHLELNYWVFEITAIEGTSFNGSWRDTIRQWNGSGGGSSAIPLGSVTLYTGSATAGTGTIGTIAKWATTTTLTNSIMTEASTTVTVAGTMAATTFSGSGSGLTSLPAGQLTGTITPATQDLITRTGTLVSGATGAGFTIALTTSTVTGNLPYANMPSGSGTWTGVPTISGILTLQSDLTVAGNAGTTSFASQTTGWRITAAGAADFRYLFTDELYAKSFIADLEQALAGGQIICKSVTTLGAAFTVPASAGTATLTVNDLPSAPNMAVFVSGDTVKVRSFSRANGGLIIGDAVGVVTAYADQAGGVQTWTFTRVTGVPGNGGSLASSTVIPINSIVLDFGTTGNGFYEVSALDGTINVTSITRTSTTATVTCTFPHGYKTGDTVVVSGATPSGYNGAQTITVTSTTAFTYTVSSGLSTPATGTILLNDANGTNAPYAQIVTWATSPVGANMTLRTRFGNLRGVTGTNGEYGMIAGTYAGTGGQYFRASNSAFELHGIDLLLWDGSTNTVKIDHAVPSIALGNPVPTAYATGTGIWMGKDTSYKFRVGVPAGNRLAWDGTNLTLVSEQLTIDNNGVTIATAPVSYASTYGFKFSTSFSGVNWEGIFAQEPDSVTRGIVLFNSTSAASKTVTTEVNAASALVQGYVRITSAVDSTIDLVAGNITLGPLSGTLVVNSAAWTANCRLAITTNTDGPIILDYGAGGGANTMIAFYRSAVFQGSITTVGGVTSYNVSSDERLKENIAPTRYGLAELLQIGVSDFTMKSDTGRTQHTGFLAQQLHDIFPGPVTVPKDPNDAWQMDYSKLTPLIVAAVQQLAARVAVLEKR